MPPPLSPENRYAQAKRGTELISLLRAFLAGQKDRADIARWTNDALLARKGTKFPHHGTAHSVFESLLNIEERNDNGFVLRNQDIAAYLEWLVKGNPFIACNEPIISISTPIETLASMMGGRDERSWLDGIGWIVMLRFASPATGRCFGVVAPLSHEHTRWSSIHAQRGEDPMDAALDVIEALAIDEADVGHWHSQLEPVKMPRWTVWRQDDNGGRFKVATHLSYSRAMRECTEMENRGHKQMYWVEN